MCIEAMNGLKRRTHVFLVGGSNRFEKKIRQIRSFLQVRVEIHHIFQAIASSINKQHEFGTLT